MTDSLVLVHGTYGRSHSWHLPGSPLRKALEGQGFYVHDFLWSGVVAGVPTLLPGDPLDSAVGADSGMLLPWLDAGEKLRLFCRVRNLDRPHLLSHSHGLQVVAFAAAVGQPFDHVVSLSGPIRRDMQRCRRAARGGITWWVQVVDPMGTDLPLLVGEAFDGEFGWQVELPEGDQTIAAMGVGHSGLLDHFDAKEWEDLGLWKALGGSPREP